jgi:uncharacterized protein YjbI with pentapeptide repeats
MANEEHLKILKQGVNAWNEWRKKNPGTEPDLSETAFWFELQVWEQERNLRSRDKLWGRKDLTRAEFKKAVLIDIDLSGVDFRGADLHGSDISRSNLSRATFCNANLREADLSGSILESADLFDAYARDADFREAECSGACFRRTDLLGADLREAVFAGADFEGAQLWRTIFGDNDLALVKGLDLARHSGPSTVGIDTIYRSKGMIPEAFLRGAGVPDDFIVYMRALAANPIEFYSCFISYSSKDDDFARRLHADLQQRNVRVWFAPEDLMIGDKFRTRIDESIRIYDKVMVVLSANSIQSPWVEEEVEAALEKERKDNKLVLFPVQLDDAVMDTQQAWAASLRRTRHIGDFRNWKDHDAYKEAFDRLLRDLKAEKTVASDK